MENSSGATLADTLVALSLVGIGLMVALPNFLTARRQASLERVARQLTADTIRCRAAAINRRSNVGLVFGEEGGEYFYGLVMDGDGDGLLRRDIERGADRQVGPRVLIDRLCRGARLGVPEGWGVPDPSGQGRLRPGDGLRAGRSDILSFSPLGDATPATVYINDGRERMLAVRVYGGTARVRVLEWRRGWSTWRRLAL
jgi:type II secretory pathway pseudopilin PulG